MKRSTRIKLLLFVGYAVLFVLCFVWFTYRSLPWDRVRDHIVREVEQPQGPRGRQASGLRLEIEELGPHYLTGIAATGIQITKMAAEPGGAAMRFRVDEAVVDLSLLSLLLGSLDVSFEVRMAGGEIAGDFSTDGESHELSAEIVDVHLRRIPAIRTSLPLPLTGTLSGSVELAVPEELTEATGTVTVQVEELTVGDSEAQVPVPGFSQGLTVEQINVGTLQIELALSEGVVRTERFETDGDIELGGSGSMRLRRPLPASPIELTARIAFSEDYKTRSEHTRRLFTVMEMAPGLAAARASGGALQYRIHGSLARGFSYDGAARARLRSPR